MSDKMGLDYKADYGKVPKAKWDAIRSRAEQEPLSEETMREDYEIGVSQERFYVDYACSCQTCGFQFSYRHEEDVKL